MAKKNLTLNESMQQLEDIVDKLEKGDCELEASLLLYEQAVKLAADCTKKINDAEQKITELSADGRTAADE